MESKQLFLGELVCNGELNETNKKNYQYFCNNITKDNKLSCCDNLEFENNKINKRIGRNIITGDEEWYYDEKTKTYYYYQFNKFNNDIGGKYDPMLCTHFRWTPYSLAPEYGYFQGGESNEIMFNYDYGKNGVDNFKKWLKEQYSKGTPVEVQYIMQFPISIYNRPLYKPNPRFIACNYSIDSNGLNPEIRTKLNISYKSY